ncbi:YutD family protein [Paenibacillus flagellatus]|uniref:DUF1027 domain-containing protein n=1 Tax=Paenibacillus flagellatus TaxID=2211139 RepID=A0A2V5KAI3_9BACL|nr:YutD family protein [Paenibacillus flagellatus]PYI50830.1 DUF1027 domain-containing protein [Paenibacillus flagellatus]
MIHIGGKTFELVQDHRNGYSFEAFRDRYSEVLDRYDYIVGDWGYNQLRLKGFFKENSKNGNKDTCVSGMHDYLNEYCNFGCAYFIVRKVPGKQGQGEAAPQQGPGETTGAGAPQENAATVSTSSSSMPPRQHQHRHERHERHDRHERHERQPRHERSQGRQQPQK